MRCNFSIGISRTRVVAAAALTCLTSVASATTTLVGGGDTFPAFGYTGNTIVRDDSSYLPLVNSLFAAYANAGGNPTTYCPSGGGAAKKILAGYDYSRFQVNGDCLANRGWAANGNLQGFGGIGLTQAHFAAVDAPLSSSEFSNYARGHGAGAQPVQLPTLVGAISIVFKKSGVTSMTLTEAQICGIFSGQITSWSDGMLSGTVPSGTTGPITVVYQQKGSGTSFSFLNHLSAVCPTNAVGTIVPATEFKTSQDFSGVDILGRPTGASAYIAFYASSILAGSLGGGGGDSGVTAAVNNTLVDGLIGYTATADAVRAPTRFASVKNSHSNQIVNPSTGFGPTAVPVNLVYDQAIGDTVDIDGRPTLTALPTTSQCIAVVNPSDYADPSAGYPILTVSYLLANAQGNGPDTAAVRSLIYSPYNTALRSSVKTIGVITTGTARLTNPDLTDTTGLAKVNSCVN